MDIKTPAQLARMKVLDLSVEIDKLTDMQLAFVEKYLELGDPGEAYIEAGYKAKDRNAARENGRKLLKHKIINAYLLKRRSFSHDHAIATADEVLAYLTAVLRGEVTDEIVQFWDGIEHRAEVKAPLRDRNRAAELLGKRYRLYVDKVEQQVDTEIRVIMPKELEEWSE